MDEPFKSDDPDLLHREHLALMRAYGHAQSRCSDALRAQARRIEQLEAQALRLRADVIVRDTAWAWVRETPAAAAPSLSIHDAAPVRLPHDPDPAALDATLADADLVICRTGCLSHGAYWRVQDHCRRTGKACVMVNEPARLRMVHVHDAHDRSGAYVVCDVAVPTRGGSAGVGPSAT